MSAQWLIRVGRSATIAGEAAGTLAEVRRWWPGLLLETYRQLVDALLLVLLLAVLAGALIAQQTGLQFQGTLPAWVIGSIVAATLITEMTPLFTAFALIGMIGTRIAAELGAMRVTEQVDAMEVMGRDPVVYLVIPRVGGSLVAAPVLMALALVVSMLAAWVSTLLFTRADSSDFWFGVRVYMRDFPMFYALLKGLVFGGAIAIIGSVCGLYAAGGSAGVGYATRRAVVLMIIAVIVLDTAMVPLLRLVRI